MIKMNLIDFIRGFRVAKTKSKLVVVRLDNRAFYRADAYDFEESKESYMVYFYREKVFIGGCRLENIEKLE